MELSRAARRSRVTCRCFGVPGGRSDSARTDDPIITALGKRAAQALPEQPVAFRNARRAGSAQPSISLQIRLTASGWLPRLLTGILPGLSQDGRGEFIRE